MTHVPASVALDQAERIRQLEAQLETLRNEFEHSNQEELRMLSEVMAERDAIKAALDLASGEVERLRADRRRLLTCKSCGWVHEPAEGQP